MPGGPSGSMCHRVAFLSLLVGGRVKLIRKGKKKLPINGQVTVRGTCGRSWGTFGNANLPVNLVETIYYLYLRKLIIMRILKAPPLWCHSTHGGMGTNSKAFRCLAEAQPYRTLTRGARVQEA